MTDVPTSMSAKVVSPAGDAGGESVEDRVAHLRLLSGEVVRHYLVLAETLYAEHEADLWQTARTPGGERYPSQEVFWEDALGIKRRTGYQLVAVGRMLSSIRLPEADRTALLSIGLHKMDALVPILERQTSATEARAWIDVAQTTTRGDLRDQVRKALGRAPRRHHRAGEQVQTFLINVMPDFETRQLATVFFDVGAVYTDTPNPVAILIAGMQEALRTWQPHLSDIELRHLGGGDHDENHDDGE